MDLDWEITASKAATRKRILASPRWELAPVKDPVQAAGDLPENAQVSMSCFASSSGFETTIRMTGDLIAKGYSVTPHLPARSISGPSELTDLLHALKEANVVDIFVVAGNTSKAVGPYEGAIDLLEDVRSAGFSIGVAAYPESHPYLNDGLAMDLLRRKQEYASYLVTQTCFDAETLHEWLKTIRGEGVDLPAYIGVAGVVQRKELLRMAAWMGVGKSMKFISKQRKLAARLVGPGAYDPSSVLDGLVDAAAGGDLGVEGVHLNTFNQVRSTRDWWENFESQGMA